MKRVFLRVFWITNLKLTKIGSSILHASHINTNEFEKEVKSFVRFGVRKAVDFLRQRATAVDDNLRCQISNLRDKVHAE